VTYGVKTKPSDSSSRKKSHALSDVQRDAVREVFENVYIANKWRIVRVNFLRGIAFGLGTFLGGTIVVAILIWILSQTVDIFPPLQRVVESLQK